MTSYAELFRPTIPEQFIGVSQEKIARSLIEDLEKGKVHREILFIGPSGTGKTSLSLMYVSYLLNCTVEESKDLMVSINCSADTGIDNIREVVIARLHTVNLFGDTKVYYLDELHGLSKSAQNALLVELENLPGHVVMIASTTEPDKIIKTLKSRFTTFELKAPTKEELKKKAGWILKTAKRDKWDVKTTEADNQVIDSIIEYSGGNVRIFDREFEKVLDGSFTGVTLPEEDEKSLFYHIWFKPKDLKLWFKLAEKETTYTQLSIGLCNFAITVLSGKKNYGANVTGKAEVILDIFGDKLIELNPTTEKISFHKKLLELYRRI